MWYNGSIQEILLIYILVQERFVQRGVIVVVVAPCILAGVVLHADVTWSLFGDVLMTVLDIDKDSKVTMGEINQQMIMLEMLFQQGKDGEEEAKEYLRMVQGAKAMAPTLFKLLDVNENQSLSRKELGWMTKFERSLSPKSEKSFKNFVRDVFAILDADGNDEIAVDELMLLVKEFDAEDGILSKLTVKFWELFPLRDSATELEGFLRSAISSVLGETNNLDETVNEADIAKHLKWVDTNGDGILQRQEVGKAYNKAGKKFLEVSKTIKTMGPMMALFGGGGGAGFGGGEF